MASLLVGCGTQNPSEGSGPDDSDGVRDSSTGDKEASSGATGGASGPGPEPAVTDGSTSSGSGTGPKPDGTGGSVAPPMGTDTGVSFVMELDVPNAALECSTWEQDCPEGQKCAPWATDGGSAWDGTHCVAISANPAEPGDRCTVEGSPTGGRDSCAQGGLCFQVDPSTKVGTCAALCGGTQDSPICDVGERCHTTNDGSLNLCLGTCDPLAQDCPSRKVCYPVGGKDFACAFDASPRGEGGLGRPCEFINTCHAGLRCAAAETVAGCTGSESCCTPFCDLNDPAGDAQCPNRAAGNKCIPFFAPGTELPGLENVGTCGIMP